MNIDEQLMAKYYYLVEMCSRPWRRRYPSYADDFYQEAYIGLWSGIEDKGKDDLKRWICACIRNRLINYYLLMIKRKGFNTFHKQYSIDIEKYPWIDRPSKEHYFLSYEYIDLIQRHIIKCKQSNQYPFNSRCLNLFSSERIIDYDQENDQILNDLFLRFLSTKQAIKKHNTCHRRIRTLRRKLIISIKESIS